MVLGGSIVDYNSGSIVDYILQIVDSVTIWVENNPVEIESIEASSGKVKLAYVLEKNVEICASFVFDVPVRFAADNFQYSFNSDGSIKVEDVELIEVYE